MKYVFNISKENAKLSLAEIKNVCKPKKFEAISAYIVLETQEELQNYSKLAYTKNVYQVLSHAKNLDKLTKNLTTKNFDENKSFRLRILKSQNREKQIKAIANIIGKNKQVNLTTFEEEYGILQTTKNIYVSKKIWENTDDYYSRNPINRPIMHPTSLKPRFAKAMINLANPKNELYDPFCGSGGILLEACMLGLKTYGTDLDKTMVLYAHRNLKHYGVKANLAIKDGFTPTRNYEAVVTDIPYGKNSKLKGGVQDFLNTFINTYTKYTNTIVVCHPNSVDVKPNAFKIGDQINHYINKSLTRTITVLKK